MKKLILTLAFTVGLLTAAELQAQQTNWTFTPPLFNSPIIVQWTAPQTGLYTITAYGAQGGGINSKQPYVLIGGGQGAIISGNLQLTAGQILNILAGEAGGIRKAVILMVVLAVVVGVSSWITTMLHPLWLQGVEEEFPVPLLERRMPLPAPQEIMLLALIKVMKKALEERTGMGEALGVIPHRLGVAVAAGSILPEDHTMPIVITMFRE